jgi:hypothetical protein
MMMILMQFVAVGAVGADWVMGAGLRCRVTVLPTFKLYAAYHGVPRRVVHPQWCHGVLG